VFLFGQLTQQFGIMTTTVTNAGFLTALYVILVPIFGIALYREWPHLVVWPAALAALAGTWLLGGGLDGIRTGDLWVMLSAIFWALQVVLLGRVVRRTGRPLFVTFAQSLAAGIVAMAVAFAVEPVSLAAIVSAWPELAVAGALSGGLAFSLQAVAQRHTAPADAAVVFSSEAVFAALAAGVLLGERLALTGWLGCALILAAVLAVQIVPLAGSRARQGIGGAQPDME
jgi:drug/metabolite transporter (DMT)-like permease